MKVSYLKKIIKTQPIILTLLTFRSPSERERERERESSMNVSDRDRSDEFLI